MVDRPKQIPSHTSCHRDALILCGASALRMIRAQRRKTGFIAWEELSPEEQHSVLRESIPRRESIDISWLVRVGAYDSEQDEQVHFLVGEARNRRYGAEFFAHVKTTELPKASLFRVEPHLYTLSPEALCAQVADELGAAVAFALAMEFCSGISLRDRSEWLPHYRCKKPDPLSKTSIADKLIGYFESEPVMTSAGLDERLGRGREAKKLRKLCRYLVPNLCSPMECIMVAMFSLPTREGGFECGPFKGNHKVVFDAKARAVSGMPYAICDAYQEEARLDLEYNGGEGHTSDSSRLHDEKRNTGLVTMGIEVLVVNKETIRDLEAMEALAWRMHKRKGKRYRNRVEGQRERQASLLNTLRTAFGLLPT